MCERVPKNVTLGANGGGKSVAAKRSNSQLGRDEPPKKVTKTACDKTAAVDKDAEVEITLNSLKDDLRKTENDTATSLESAAPDGAPANVMMKASRLTGGGLPSRIPIRTNGAGATRIPVRTGAVRRGGGGASAAIGVAVGFGTGARTSQSPAPKALSDAGVRLKLDKPAAVGDAGIQSEIDEPADKYKLSCDLNPGAPFRSNSSLDISGPKPLGLPERAATQIKMERGLRNGSPAVRTVVGAKNLKNEKCTVSAHNHQNVLVKNKLQIFEKELLNLKKQQSIFMAHCEKMDCFVIDKLDRKYKFVAMVLTDQCKLIVNKDDLLRLPKKIPYESVNDLKERINLTFGNIVQFLCDQLDKHECRDQFSNIYNNLVGHKDELLAGLKDYVNLLCKECQSKVDTQAARALEELSKSRRKYADLELDLLNERSKHEKIENELQIKLKEQINEELLKHEAYKAEYNAKYDELNSKVSDLHQQLAMKTCEQEDLAKQLKELHVEHEVLKGTVEKYRKLEKDLKEDLLKSQDDLQESLTKVESLKRDLDLNKELMSAYESRPPMEELKSKDDIITQLKGEIKILEKAKCTCLNEMKDLSKRCDEYNKLMQKLRKSEAIVTELTSKVEKLTKKLEESEKKRISEVEALKKELEEAKQLKERQEAELERQQDILQVRSEMIAKLQTDEINANKKIAETNTELNEKSNLIKQLENDLAVSKSDFNNLFTSFGAQQIEISHQKMVIKLMEEGNDRAQMLRVQQEKRISDGDDEIDELKDTIRRKRYGKKTKNEITTRQELRRAVEKIENKKMKPSDKKDEKKGKKK